VVEREAAVDQLPGLGRARGPAALAPAVRLLGAPGLVQFRQRQVQAQAQRTGGGAQHGHTRAVRALQEVPVQAVLGVLVIQQQGPGPQAGLFVRAEFRLQQRLQPGVGSGFATRACGRGRHHEVEGERDAPSLLHRQHLVAAVGVEGAPAQL